MHVCISCRRPYSATVELSLGISSMYNVVIGCVVNSYCMLNTSASTANINCLFTKHNSSVCIRAHVSSNFFYFETRFTMRLIKSSIRSSLGLSVCSCVYCVFALFSFLYVGRRETAGLTMLGRNHRRNEHPAGAFFPSFGQVARVHNLWRTAAWRRQ